MKLIVGLGNPGKEYDNTRHNIGFMVIDGYLGHEKYQSKFNALYKEMNIRENKVIFVKPLTYMNNSGIAVQEFVKYYDIDIKDILVIQDDLDQDMGSFKLKVHSSSGGHNGIKSIIAALHSEDFPRLKIGIKTKEKGNVIDYVLGKFGKMERESIDKNMDTFKDIIDSFIDNDIDKTMNIYNTK